MEHTYQYSWVITFITLPALVLIGTRFLLFWAATSCLNLTGIRDDERSCYPQKFLG